MQRPQDEEDERLRRERLNHVANQNSPLPLYAGQSPTQAVYNGPSSYSPTKSLPRRASFTQQYHHPPTPSQPPASAHRAPSEASPSNATLTPYQSSEYHSAPRDKPTSNYYDPTSDSGEPRPGDPTRHNGQNPAPQVSSLTQGVMIGISYLTRSLSAEQSRLLYLDPDWQRIEKLSERRLHIASECHLPRAPVARHITFTPSKPAGIDCPITQGDNGYGDSRRKAEQWGRCCRTRRASDGFTKRMFPFSCRQLRRDYIEQYK